MIQAKVTRNFDLSKIKLDLHRELNQGIDIIADNISEGIDTGGQFGKKFKEIEPETGKRKGHFQPLIEDGILRDADRMQKTKATPAKQEATLLPAEERVDISFWHNTGAKPNPKREHWGISTRASIRYCRTPVFLRYARGAIRYARLVALIAIIY
jgi:hypothetical protein